MRSYEKLMRPPSELWLWWQGLVCFDVFYYTVCCINLQGTAFSKGITQQEALTHNLTYSAAEEQSFIFSSAQMHTTVLPGNSSVIQIYTVLHIHRTFTMVSGVSNTCMSSFYLMLLYFMFIVSILLQIFANSVYLYAWGEQWDNIKMCCQCAAVSGYFCKTWF